MGSVSGSGGRVTSILRPEEADQMYDLGRELNFTFTDVDYLDADIVSGEMDKGELYASEENGGGDVEKMRRYLEDTITLLDLAEDPVVDLDAVASRPPVEYDDEGGDGDDNDEDMEEGYQ
jgi:hypothetical protein